MVAAVLVAVAAAFALSPAVGLGADARVELKAAFSPAASRVGEIAVLEIGVKIPTGYHFYSMTDIKEGPLRMQVVVGDPALSPVTEWFGPKPEVAFDPNFKKHVEYYAGAVV